MSENIFKPVADAFALIHAGGEPYSWTKDQKSAVDWLKENPKYSVQGFVSLEKYQSAISDDLAALQQKLDAVLAENAALKDINAWCKTEAFENMYREFKTAEAIGCPDIDCMHDAMLTAIMHAPPTPATDSILNEVRAEGVEMFIGELSELFRSLKPGGKPWQSVKGIAMRAISFADQLRAGKGGE